ncbi:MAG: two-component system heavy metal sensor histidine kinase CusS [Rhodothermales bacterium]|jgi:two-component system heavy metal sensor histidine kinase CusS
MTLHTRLFTLVTAAIAAAALAVLLANSFISSPAPRAAATLGSLAIIAVILRRAINRSLAPMRHLVHAAKSQELSAPRLAESAAPEFAELAAALGKMMEQAERSVNQANRFSADAAHELQTPLTILQGHIEDGLQHAKGDEQERLSLLLRQVQRLKEVVHKLLLLSRADAGTLTTRNRRIINIGELLNPALEDFDILAPELTLESEVADGCCTDGVEALIAHLLRNLISNAIKYNQAGGTVRVVLREELGNACLRVGNTGAGIPTHARSRVFERFFRADESRNQGVPGSGLGLSLAREIAKSHCGDLQLEPDLGDGWTWFRATLPPPI